MRPRAHIWWLSFCVWYWTIVYCHSHSSWRPNTRLLVFSRFVDPIGITLSSVGVAGLYWCLLSDSKLVLWLMSLDWRPFFFYSQLGCNHFANMETHTYRSICKSYNHVHTWIVYMYMYVHIILFWYIYIFSMYISELTLSIYNIIQILPEDNSLGCTQVETSWWIGNKNCQILRRTHSKLCYM